MPTYYSTCLVEDLFDLLSKQTHFYLLIQLLVLSKTHSDSLSYRESFSVFTHYRQLAEVKLQIPCLEPQRLQNGLEGHTAHLHSLHKSKYSRQSLVGTVHSTDRNSFPFLKYI